MLTEVIASSGVRCWLWTGSDNSDDDYVRWIRAISEVVREPLATVVMVVEPGNPTPPAIWRKRIADASRQPRPDGLFIMVTISAVVRGALTAINWIRPPTFQIVVCATVTEAAVAVAERRQLPREHVLDLVALARAKTARSPRAMP